MNKGLRPRLSRLFGNSRFWILLVGVDVSILIAGFIQLYVPSGSLQIIRIGQCYGFISIILLYFAVLASPLTKAFPGLFFKEAYLHARRAIGVLAFYYAFLHTYLTFFKQLNGFAGLKYLNTRYSESLLFGVIGLAILFIMASTSLDWVVDKMHFKNWKLLHRLVYIASIAILLHIIILGPHYTDLNLVSGLTYVAIVFIMVLEAMRIYKLIYGRKTSKSRKKVIK